MEERAANLQTFTTRSAARILAVSPDRIRYWVKRQLVKPAAVEGGRYQFGFNDLLVMRLTKELLPMRHHLQPIRRCFERLSTILDRRRLVTSLKVFEEDGRIVVRDGGLKFEADTGQLLLDFDLRRFESEAGAPDEDNLRELADRALALEESEPARAAQLYLRALESGPGNSELRIRLGALLERAGDAPGALRHYLHAVTAAPDDGGVHLSLGRLYRKLEKPERAVRSYLRVLALDPDSAEAHQNLAELYEQIGRKRDALRHLSALHRLTRSD